MKRYIFILFITTCFAITADAGDDTTVTIAYTASLNGNIDSCACKSSPKGGLVKRGTAIDKIRHKYRNLILVDTGDFMPTYMDNTLPDYIAKAYAYLKYDAISFGDQDLDIGVDRFLRVTGQLPLISTNTAFSSGTTSLPAYRIIKKGKYTVAVIALQDPESYTYALSGTRQEIRIEDISSAANRTVSFLREKEHPDAVVMLFHSSLERAIEIEKKIYGIDIIIGGHDRSFTEKPVYGERAVIAFPGGYGSRIGIMEIEFRNAAISMKSNTFLLPDRSNTSDDSYIRGLIDEYRNRSD